MSDIRPELSKKNQYWIPKERYYELLHFCRQYPDWKKYCCWFQYPSNTDMIFDKNHTSRPTETMFEKHESFMKKIKAVEDAAKCTDEMLGFYILKGIVLGKNYNSLRSISNIPCCRDTYYDLYHKFFYILDQIL